MKKETGVLVGIFAVATGFMFGEILLLMAGSIVLLMETTSDV